MDLKWDASPGWSPYQYAHNNPLLRVDPFGLTDINIYVIRMFQIDQSTLGNFVITNSENMETVTGATLELPDRNNEKNISRIDEGIYEAYRTQSSRNGEVVQFKDVNSRTGIQIHRGNFPQDTKGCILFGRSLEKDYVGKSRNAMKTVNEYIEKIEKRDQETNEETTLSVEVIDEPVYDK